mmetsp:Transcript_8157/g.18664  ORF Transcript_8157/g.18664 Transcript_8157/m.18664 type:complete len:270 (-) Transcript_8157:88-897(-)
MISAYLSSTTLRFNFFVGVSSLPSSEKFVGRMANLWILKALFLQTFPLPFAAWMAAVIVSIHTLSSMASTMVVTSGLIFFAPASNCCVPAHSPLAPTALRVTKATLYFRLSPSIMTSLMPSHALFTHSSMGTGAMFSPPSPMMSSLYLPVIFTMPCAVTMPLSPEWSHPSASMVSAFLASMSLRCSGPRSGHAMYPIMIVRPRKQSSPWYSSSALSRWGARGHSVFLLMSLGSTAKTFTSKPGISQPMEPHWCASSVDMVLAPAHSDMP